MICVFLLHVNNTTATGGLKLLCGSEAGLTVKISQTKANENEPLCSAGLSRQKAQTS
jgi:hypothetical protein